jgi:uncharacterized protein YecT (DUF1311 family)
MNANASAGSQCEMKCMTRHRVDMSLRGARRARSPRFGVAQDRFRGRLVRLALALPIVLPLAIAHAASFDCTKAATKTEKTICADATLSGLDSLLAQTYKAVMAKHPGDKHFAGYLVGSQKNWLSRRDACATPKCVLEAYTERIDSLRHDQLPDEMFPLPHNASDWSACVAPSDLGQAHCQREIRCAENSNGSYFVAVGDICPLAALSIRNMGTEPGQKTGSGSVRLYFYPQREKPGPLLTTLLDVQNEGQHFPITSFEFESSLDRNGYAALYIQSASGGTNVFAVSQNLYRFDPKDSVPYLYYAGTFDSLRYSNERVVAVLPGREGAYFEIHDVHQKGTRDVVDDQSIGISVEEDPDNHDPTGCTFTDAAGKKIKPPNPKWVDEFCMGAPVAAP